MAQLIAVTQAMQAQGPDAQVNQAQLAADATAILGKKSFKQAMEDTDAKDAKNLSLPIDKSAFSNAVEATMKTLDFQRMVERYENDPSYRKNINANLAETGGANVLQELYKLEQQHKKPKPVQPQVQMK